jgi:hypothetical protein
MTRDREVQSAGAYYCVGLGRRGRFFVPFTNRVDTFTCSLDDADAFTAVLEPRTLPIGVRLKKEAMKECRARSVCRGSLGVGRSVIWCTLSISTQVVNIFDRQV